MRRSALPLFSACLMLAALSPAAAQTDAATQANRRAYDAATRCYVAYALEARRETKEGNATKASNLTSTAKRAFDGARSLGQILGRPKSIIESEIDAAEASEAPRMLASRGYHRQTLDMCRELGLK